MCRAAQHAPTFFCAATLHDSLFLGRVGWHLRHKADKAPGVTSMRPVGAVTMPLAMQSHEMDNIELKILAKQEKRHQLLAHFSSSEGNKAKSEPKEGAHLGLQGRDSI